MVEFINVRGCRPKVEYINLGGYFPLRSDTLANILDKLVDSALTGNQGLPKVTHSVTALSIERKYPAFGFPTVDREFMSSLVNAGFSLR